MSRTKNSARNIGWGLATNLVNVAFPFVNRTVLLYTMGKLYLGLSSLFTSVLSILNLMELGFCTAIIYCMYEPLAKNDVDAVCKLLNFYKKYYRAIGAAILGIGLLVTPFIKYIISGDYPNDINLYVLYIIYLLNTACSYFLFSYRKSLLVATQRQDVTSKITLLTNVVQYTLQFVLLFTLHNYYIYALLLLAGTIFNNLFNGYVSYKLFPQYRCRGKIPKTQFDQIIKNVKALVFQKIGWVILTSVDNIVISAFLGLAILAEYNNYYCIVNALLGIISVIVSSIKASVGDSLVQNSKEKNMKNLRVFNFAFLWIIGWCSVCLLCLFQDFIKIWVGSSMLLPFSIPLLLAAYFYVYKSCDMLYVYQEAAGIWWVTRWVPLIAGAFNLLVNIMLVKLIGLDGIVISTILSFLFVYNIGYIYAIFDNLFSSKKELKYFCVQQLMSVAVTALAGIVTYAVCRLIGNSGIGAFAVKCVICVVLPNIIYLALYCKKKEFGDTLKILKRILKIQK